MSDDTYESRVSSNDTTAELERLEAELDEVKKALRTTEDKYKALTEQLPVGVYRTNRQGEILQGNPALARILGHNIEDLAGVPADAVFDDPHERKTQLRQWHQTGGVVSNELRFKTGDGRKIWIRDTGQALLDKNGEVEFFSGIIEDITARRIAEEELREQRERLNTVLESIGEGVVAIDIQHNVVLANPKAREYLSALGDISIKQLLDSPPDNLLFHEIVVEDPERRVFEVSSHIMRADILTSGWVLLLREVTQERGVRQRMESQSRMAAMGQLAAGVAHDFNNALLVMMSNAELVLRSQNLSERDRARLLNIRETAEQTAKTIRQIMDFTRQSPAQRNKIDLAKVSQAVVEMLARTMPHNVELGFHAAAGEYILEAELAGIQHVLTNFVLNARDAMPEGGTIGVSLKRVRFEPGQELPHPEMNQTDWAVLQINDNGSGIAEETLPNIFEPFFTTKGPSNRAGLGLAQVYGIIKQHAGHIDVETEIGRGSVFTVYLPLESNGS